MSGLVSLVGAGPGDPDLLTRKAANRLEQADLVLYDALVDPKVLDLAPRARRLFVGKRAGRKSMKQETIHGLLIRAARRGERVVRLKGGDPFVFGRGGEEALACVAAGVPCEVIPGISSAVAGPALAGIPVTHRGVAAAFTVVAGQPGDQAARVLATLAPNGQTVVVLMALATRAALADTLLGGGWRADTPAAIVLAASTSRQQRWLGTLRDLGGAELPEDSLDCPGLLVVGDVVKFAAALVPEVGLVAAG